MSECEEVWKDIKGYENKYQVSNVGRVRGIERFIANNRYPTFKKKINGKVLKPWNNGNGYLVVTLKNNGKRKNKYVHRLVIENFVSYIDKGMVVNHIDFDRTNNILSNLEMVTQKENTNHSARNHRMSRGNIKRSDGMIYNSMTEAAKMNNVTVSSIASAIDRYHECKGFLFERMYKVKSR